MIDPVATRFCLLTCGCRILACPGSSNSIEVTIDSTNSDAVGAATAAA